MASMPATSPQELHALLEAAFTSGDLDALIALFEPDATMRVPPDGHAVSGRDAIRAALAPIVARRPRFTSEVVVLATAGELALTHARWTMDDTDGRGTLVLRRQPDGTWRIAIDNPLGAR